jgi:drug/metabolite transporter (DMT)-like permease
MSTAGLVLITGTAGGGSSDLLGIAFGLGAAVLYATVMLLNKFIKGGTGLHRTFIQFLAAIAVLTPYVALASGFNPTALDGRGGGRAGVAQGSFRRELSEIISYFENMAAD